MNKKINETKIPLLLLVKYNKKYTVYSPYTFGMETWGANYQRGIEKKRKNWYITHWIGGDEYHEDRYGEIKLNVVLETSSTSAVLKEIKKKDIKQLDRIKLEIKEILNDWKILKLWLKRKNIYE